MGPANSERRAAVRERLSAESKAALLVTSLPNIRYLSGFTGSSAVLVVGSVPPDLLLTDSRYEEQAAHEVDSDIDRVVASVPRLQAAREHLAEVDGSVGFEDNHFSVAQLTEWDSAGGPPLEATRSWIESMRATKSHHEIEAMRGAAQIADATFSDMLDRIRGPITERELAAELLYRLLSNGAEGPSFEPIVAFGERAALPHARPSDRRLEKGDVVLFDFGAIVDGYCSDMSRTVSWGVPDSRLVEMYTTVLDAQQTAIDGTRAGMMGSEADALARDVIRSAGYGDQFGHSVGHGIGLEVHEQPSISPSSDDHLVPDMVVTVEPGIYIKNLGGVRIEDVIVVGQKDVEILAHSPKNELIIL